jgi:hypothetical protein
MSTMGRGFWIMDDISPLREFNQAMQSDRAFLFSPEEAFRSNSTSGANIDYYLPGKINELKLVVRDGDGNELSQIRIENSEGFHRSNWRLTSGQSSQNSYSRRYSGIKVVPGTYNIILEAPDLTLVKSIEVKADPRVVEAGMTQEDFQEQYDLCLKVQDLQGRTRELHSKVDSLIKPLQEKAQGSRLKARGLKKYEELDRIRKELITESGPYPQPVLMGQISYLLSMISRTDQKPGKDAYIRLDELTTWFNELESSLDEIK